MIYILRDGETDGPHEPGLVQAFLDTNEIGPDCLACIEGMKKWRAVGEVLVWARGKLLSEVRDVVWEEVKKLKDGKITDAQTRMNIRKALPKERTSDDSKAFDSFNIILRANASLLRNIEHVDNSPDELELFPGWELYQMDKPAFPRDWKSAWLGAGGKMSGERMVARKDDPVWLKLSDFGYCRRRGDESLAFFSQKIRVSSRRLLRRRGFLKIFRDGMDGADGGFGDTREWVQSRG